MGFSQYHFVTRWRLHGTPEEIFALLTRPEEFPRWWGAVYLEATEVQSGDTNGVGRSFHFKTKGWLPYRFRWDSIVTEVVHPQRLVMRSTGDLPGRESWTLDGDSHFTDILFDWEVAAAKPLLRYLSVFLKPIFKANHRWAMKQGRIAMELELKRRREQTVHAVAVANHHAEAVGVQHLTPPAA